MRFQTSLFSLLLPALVLAPYVDASARKNKKKKKGKNKKVLILSDDSIGRGDAVSLPSSPALVPNTNIAPLVKVSPMSTKSLEEMNRSRDLKS